MGKDWTKETGAQDHPHTMMHSNALATAVQRLRRFRKWEQRSSETLMQLTFVRLPASGNSAAKHHRAHNQNKPTLTPDICKANKIKLIG